MSDVHVPQPDAERPDGDAAAAQVASLGLLDELKRPTTRLHREESALEALQALEKQAALQSAKEAEACPKDDETPEAYEGRPDSAQLLLALVVAFATAWLWRGIWLLMDERLFPSSRWLSATVGLVIGVALFGALAVLRERGEVAALRCPGRWLWALDACYSYGGVWASVLVWRGWWQLGDLLFERDTATSHACGALVLLALGAARSACACPMVCVADAAPPLLRGPAETAPGARGDSESSRGDGRSAGPCRAADRSPRASAARPRRRPRTPPCDTARRFRGARGRACPARSPPRALPRKRGRPAAGGLGPP